MELIKLFVEGIYSEFQASAFLMILSEEKGEKQLPVVIGAFEAQAIAIGLEEKIKPSRPLSHDLFKQFADCFDIQINKVVIHTLKEGVFFSNLYCQRGDIEKIVDARTSDAIALALRFGAPIYTNENILNKAASTKINIHVKQRKPSTRNLLDTIMDESTDPKTLSRNLKELPLKELNKILEKLVSLEKYEIAVHVRDEITSRTSRTS